MEVSPQALVIAIPWWLILGPLLIAIFLFRKRLGGYLRGWEAVSAEINFADLGTVIIKPNHADIQIAHQAWVELATRKAGLPFDSEHDVIVEIYDSWYALFGRLRDLAKECPASKIRTDGNTRQLVATLTQVLNKGMRPHLTRWQARFRRWYATAIEGASHSVTPQEVQRQYPEYDDLVEDLAKVQEGLSRYMELLKQLSTGE